jgi:peptide/nickel transport system permease protein
MWFFIARRVLYAVPILLGASLVVFLLMKMVPGDAADILVPPEASKEVAAMIRARFGLDQPIHVQYLRWLQAMAMASGDFGVSIFTN